MTTGATAGGILARLRHETRAEHEAIEAALDLMDPGLTPSAYRRRLGQFLGVIRPSEARLRAIGGWAGLGVDLEARRKAPRLEADLRALGDPDPDRIPDCPDLPALGTAAEGFGYLYVLEGSTLGGQLIGRHLRATLGLTPESGAGYFHGYGERTGAMWREFGAALTAFAVDGATQDRVVASANATFRALRG